MPIYAYRCSACGHAKDVLQKLSEEPLTQCPACGAEAFSKQLTAAGFQLKGSGWYVTDFRGGNSGAKADGEKGEKGEGDKAAGDKPKAEGSPPTTSAGAGAAAPAAASAAPAAPAPAAAAPSAPSSSAPAP